MACGQVACVWKLTPLLVGGRLAPLVCKRSIALRMLGLGLARHSLSLQQMALLLPRAAGSAAARRAWVEPGAFLSLQDSCRQPAYLLWEPCPPLPAAWEGEKAPGRGLQGGSELELIRHLARDGMRRAGEPGFLGVGALEAGGGEASHYPVWRPGLRAVLLPRSLLCRPPCWPPGQTFPCSEGHTTGWGACDCSLGLMFRSVCRILLGSFLSVLSPLLPPLLPPFPVTQAPS